MDFDPLALLIFLIFIATPLLRGLLRGGQNPQQRRPSRPMPGGPVAFPVPPPRAPRTQAPAAPRPAPEPFAEATGEGVGMEGPDTDPDLVAREAEELGRAAEGLAGSLEQESRRLAVDVRRLDEEAERVNRLGQAFGARLEAPPEVPGQEGPTAMLEVGAPVPPPAPERVPAVAFATAAEAARAVMLAEVLGRPRARRPYRLGGRR